MFKLYTSKEERMKEEVKKIYKRRNKKYINVKIKIQF
jgi:hypothetical protein